MHKTIYRTHTCAQLRKSHEGQAVTLAGWIHRKRDHGSLIFIDLRDHYGLTQCVMEKTHAEFNQLADLPLESVISLTGQVRARPSQTCNAHLETGEIEVAFDQWTVLSQADPLPFPVHGEVELPEEMRLRYRFLDLRKSAVHETMVLRSQVISFIRQWMTTHGFLEIQTPILTASSPEGARDYLVPSRLYPGEFYALPQAPQQFKQLLMASGFDRYFQIAPCFRDEASRADRSPGEFYQLDMEMAFVTQEDVWAILEAVLYETFCQFAPKGFAISPPPFPRIPYDEALLTYGTDKPDLRNPLKISDFTEALTLNLFAPLVEKGAVVRGICVPGGADAPKKIFKTIQEWVTQHKGPGLGYICRTSDGISGPLVKFCSEGQLQWLKEQLHQGDCLFLVCEHPTPLLPFLSQFRMFLAEIFELYHPQAYAFCWITDFPMYEKDAETGQIVFFHNPFSMPQGGMTALLGDPLAVKAYQYDIVCNGVELSSGAIRNHLPALMYKAFEIAGYGRDSVEKQFGALLKAFHYGVPPHGGAAPGIDRMVMLLARTLNIREVIPFPLTPHARDLLMGAPSPASAERLKELYLSVNVPSSRRGQG